MPRRPIANAEEPWLDRPARQPRWFRPETQRQPRVASRRVASGSPFPLKRVQGSYSSGPLAALQATLRAAVDKERAPNLVIGSAPFPVVIGSEHGLAGRVLDLNLPVLLNIRGHI